MGVPNLAICSNNLLRAVHLQQAFHKGLLSSTVRYMGGFKSCKVPVKKKKKVTCRTPLVTPPEYFKRPYPCKTDEELTTERSLGVYLRCDPPYRPLSLCMGPCFNEPRLDTLLYRPSKYLDKSYKRYWVDCVMERKQKQVCIAVKPKIPRRQLRKISECNIPPPKKGTCKTLRPLPCKFFKPSPPLSELGCEKHPLCECPVARKVPSCKKKPKPQANIRRQLTQYPSFSECKTDKLKVAPITECHRTFSMCEAWRAFRRRHS